MNRFDYLLYRLGRDLTHGRTIKEVKEGKFWEYFEVLAAIKTNTILWADLPISFKKERNLPGRDTGIDSANCIDGKSTAVQAKYYPNTKSVTTSACNMFIGSALGCDKPFDELIIVTTEGVSYVGVTKVICGNGKNDTLM